MASSGSISARNGCMRITVMVGKPDCTVHLAMQACTAAGMPQLAQLVEAVQLLEVAQLAHLGRVSKMPDGSVRKQSSFAEELRVAEMWASCATECGTG
eukprot:352126-Chlamydomonas_euryale.AAC.1